MTRLLGRARNGYGTKGILFRVGVTLYLFAAAVVVFGGVHRHLDQVETYDRFCETQARQAADLLGESLTESPEDLADVLDYVRTEVLTGKTRGSDLVPVDYWRSSQSALVDFGRGFDLEYPGKTFKVDVGYRGLSPGLKRLWVVCGLERWLALYSRVTRDFRFKYVCFLVRGTEEGHVVCVVDGNRGRRLVPDANRRVLQFVLGFDVLPEKLNQSPEVFRVLNGETAWARATVDGGLTRVYYAPVKVNGTVVGAVGVEVDVGAVAEDVLRSTVRQSVGLVIILVCVNAVALWFIYSQYVGRLENLELLVREYAVTKDLGLAGAVERQGAVGDEIGSLAREFSGLMFEVKNYAVALTRASDEAEDVDRLKRLAYVDALTGAGNRLGYEEETALLDAGNSLDYGIVVADVNGLKAVNDVEGHEAGNRLIVGLAEALTEVFPESGVYRVGGDEFVVVAKAGDYLELRARVDALEAALTERGVSAAVGFARASYFDGTSAAVFATADKAMYARKRTMKAAQRARTKGERRDAAEN